MSAVYSYGAARRDDHMINVVKMSADVLKDANMALLGIFSTFPSRWSHHPQHRVVVYYLMCSFPSPILAAWHESQETRPFIQEIVSRPLEHSIYVYGVRSRKCNTMWSTLFTRICPGYGIHLSLFSR